MRLSKRKASAGFEAGFEVFCGVDLVSGNDEGFGEAIAAGRKERGSGGGDPSMSVRQIADLEANAREMDVAQVEVDADVAVPSAVAGGVGGLGVFVDQGRVGDVDMGAEELDDERDDRRVSGQLGEGGVLD